MGYEDKNKAERHCMYGMWAAIILPPLISVMYKLLFQ